MRMRACLCFSVLYCISAIAALPLVPSSQAQSQLSKEYIYVGGRLLATETPGPTPIMPPAGISAWWAGDGDATDSIAAINGTMNGATFAQGKVGQAFSFDGIDGFVEIPTMNLGRAFSVELWMYPLGGSGHLVSNSSSSSNYGALVFDTLYGNHISYVQGGRVWVSSAGGSVPSNTWSHIALTYDGDLSRLYINGTLRSTSSPYLMIFNNSLRLGYSVNNAGSHFKGLMDEVTLYDRALSLDEVQAVFNAGSLGKAKYQFNINTTILPTMFVSNPASYQISTLYGTPPVSFSLTSGTIPPGMALSASGVISGTPTTEGNFSFTVQAVDALGRTASRTITASVLTAQIPPSGLVSWWPGDGNANDIVGGSNGTFQNGAQYLQSGKVAEAFWLDGTNDYVDVPSINLGRAFSVELWMCPLGGSGHLVSNSSSSSNYGALVFDTFYGNHVYYSQGGYSRVSSAGGSVPSNTWSHIALTYDGFLSRLYINGTLHSTSSTPYLMTFNNPLRLGYSVDNAGSHFNGLMDEVTLYDRALSAEEVQAVFNAGSRGKAKWQFNITTTSLPNLYVGCSASSQIATAFGSAPVSFAVASGELPPGTILSLSGLISGMPTAAGEFSFTVQAVDAGGHSC